MSSAYSLVPLVVFATQVACERRESFANTPAKVLYRLYPSILLTSDKNVLHIHI